MPDGLVSIIIPAFNHERYIRECLDSCLLDPDVPVEVLVLDDGSSDRTFEVAQEWGRDHGHRLARFEAWKRANKGLCATLNELILKSRGEFVALLASDDMLVAGGIAARRSFLRDHPGVLAVFGDATPVDPAGVPLADSWLTGLEVKSSKTALASPELLLNELLLRWNVPGPVFMARRAAYDPGTGVGLYDEQMFFEDRDMYLRLAGRGQLAFVDRVVAKYRIASTSMSGSKEHLPKMRRAMVQAHRRALAHCSGSARWILRLLVVSGEGRLTRRPRWFWYPVAWAAVIARRAWLVAHDVQVRLRASARVNDA